jgi:hypothetical protein
MKATELKRGDNCPSCHGELQAAYVPTDDELRRARDHENPIALPTGADTATPEQRDDLGELFVCGRCGYRTRFAAEQGEPASDRNGGSAARRGDAQQHGNAHA